MYANSPAIIWERELAVRIVIYVGLFISTRCGFCFCDMLECHDGSRSFVFFLSLLCLFFIVSRGIHDYFEEDGLCVLYLIFGNNDIYRHSSVTLLNQLFFFFFAHQYNIE